MQLTFSPESSGSDAKRIIQQKYIPPEDIIKLYEAVNCPSWKRLVTFLTAKSDRAGRKPEERKEDIYLYGMMDMAKFIIMLREETLRGQKKA